MEENVTIMTVLQELREFRSENNKRWEENDKRFDKLEQKVDKLEQKVDKLEQKVDKHHKEMCSAFDAYENSIENMYQDNKKRIVSLEKILKVVNG